ncbi:hypothetical protein ALI22I_05425 [Saccharothrix sp. ALI-22-I]|nr:hypothetical protein ALI22I_05425 [Saccharothrix sp. ALI-22-I]
MMSTSEFQDRASSRLWQLEMSTLLVEGYGTVVVSFFDEGASRRRKWCNRPEAARLLAAVGDPDRGFDAIVVGSTSGRSVGGSSTSWCRCCSGMVSGSGCRRWAGRWIWRIRISGGICGSWVRGRCVR